jgi:hypothetical protein
MMTSQEEQMNDELAKRAVACKGWKWMGGMLTLCKIRVIEGGSDYLIGERPGPASDGGGRIDTTDVHNYLPDLEDPATLGCLLAILREVYGSKYVHAEAHEIRTAPYIRHAESYEFDEENSFWSVWASGRSWEGDTEVEALIVALEASP